MSVFSGAGIELCWWSTRGMSLTRRVLCTERTAASMPALRTGWGTLSRQKWWSCRRTRVPTPPRCSAASTQWCSHSATFPAWRAGISPRSPPCSRTEAPRRWTRTRRLKNKGCTGRKLNYRGPSFFFSFSFFFLSLSPSSSALCVLERLRLRSGGSDERGRSIRRRALLQINEQAEAFRPLHLIFIQAVELFLFNSVPICNSWSIQQLIMTWCNFPFRYKDSSSCHSDCLTGWYMRSGSAGSNSSLKLSDVFMFHGCTILQKPWGSCVNFYFQSLIKIIFSPVFMTGDLVKKGFAGKVLLLCFILLFSSMKCGKRWRRGKKKAWFHTSHMKTRSWVINTGENII